MAFELCEWSMHARLSFIHTLNLTLIFLQGLKMVFANECWHRSLDTLMAKIRKELGDMPVYLTFDIDAIDSMDCPGTGEHYKTVMCMFVYLDTA